MIFGRRDAALRVHLNYLDELAKDDPPGSWWQRLEAYARSFFVQPVACTKPTSAEVYQYLISNINVLYASDSPTLRDILLEADKATGMRSGNVVPVAMVCSTEGLHKLFDPRNASIFDKTTNLNLIEKGYVGTALGVHVFRHSVGGKQHHFTVFGMDEGGRQRFYTFLKGQS